MDNHGPHGKKTKSILVFPCIPCIPWLSIKTFMLGFTTGPWLQRWLFRLTLGLAGTMFLLVALAPNLEGVLERGNLLSRILALFSRDAVVRRTAVGAGVGLVVTAFVFFHLPQRRSFRPPSPPRKMAGA
jgi:hypothetical protein